MAKKIKTHYDDGGDVDLGDGGDNLEPIAPTATYMSEGNSGAPSAADIANLTGAGSPNGVDQVNANVNGALPSSLSVNYGSGASQAGTGALASALKALGLGGGNTSNTAVLGALTGLLQAYGTTKNNQAKGTLPTLPTLPGSTTPAGYGPAGGYNFGNYAGATASTPGVGYAPVAQAPAKPAASYYTYGQGPQQQQFQQVNGGAPITPITMAKGGHVAKYDIGGPVPMGGMNPVARPPMPPQGGLTAAAPQPPQTMTGGMGMPQQPPRPMQPQIPQQQRPAMPQPVQSVMAQRMAAARQPGQRAFAEGGSAIVGAMPGATATMVAAPQMVQSQGIQQGGNNLAKLLPGFHRGMGAAGHTPGLAGGGALSEAIHSTQPGVSRHITGPGDGTSDSIPARLANGEYVIDAQAVSMLGNGDNSAGAKRLDEFRKNLRQHKGGQLAKGKMAPDAKPVEHYMGEK